jgi:hypothetical protein
VFFRVIPWPNFFFASHLGHLFGEQALLQSSPRTDTERHGIKHHQTYFRGQISSLPAISGISLVSKRHYRVRHGRTRNDTESSITKPISVLIRVIPWPIFFLATSQNLHLGVLMS